MAKFTKRTSAPSKSSKYYYSDNIFYQCGYGMPNCTCYAWGRWYELLGSKPKLCTANAENWYKYNDGYKRGSKPKLGAIMVWRKGQVGVSSDGAGHVAVVEHIYSDESVDCSNSAWGGTNFYMKKLAKGYHLNGYVFLGFIYLPIEFDEEKKETPTAVKTNKTNVQLACEVWAGKHGNGEARKKSLGSKYNAVQTLVEKGVGRQKTPTVKALAEEVLNGLWGNGSDRRKKLTEAGFDYDAVQKQVNSMYY